MALSIATSSYTLSTYTVLMLALPETALIGVFGEQSIDGFSTSLRKMFISVSALAT
jgi:hypothetical protein